MKPREIKLVPAPEKSQLGDYNIYPGRKAVMVDGELYGYAIMHARGVNGNAYSFQQAAGETITEKVKVGLRGLERFRSVEVWGNKVAQRQFPPDVRPVEVRLLEMATKLVEDGRLISEAKQRRSIEEGAIRLKAATERAEAKKAAAWSKRAAACLPGGALPNEDENADTIARIVAAMKWAQRQ